MLPTRAVVPVSQSLMSAHSACAVRTLQGDAFTSHKTHVLQLSEFPFSPPRPASDTVEVHVADVEAALTSLLVNRDIVGASWVALRWQFLTRCRRATARQVLSCLWLMQDKVAKRFAGMGFSARATPRTSHSAARWSRFSSLTTSDDALTLSVSSSPSTATRLTWTKGSCVPGMGCPAGV